MSNRPADVRRNKARQVRHHWAHPIVQSLCLSIIQHARDAQQLYSVIPIDKLAKYQIDLAPKVLCIRREHPTFPNQRRDFRQGESVYEGTLCPFTILQLLQ